MGSFNGKFSLDLPRETLVTMLLNSYITNVGNRCGQFIRDEATLAHIDSLAEVLTNPGRHFGVMLCGNVGNGKSTLMQSFGDVIHWLDYRGFFKESTVFTIYKSKDIVAFCKNRDQYENLRSKSMLGIDDLGEEQTELKEYGNHTSPIIDLLEYRYDKRLFTFLTTNIPVRKIRPRYGERLADRFNEMVVTIPFENNSYRDL